MRVRVTGLRGVPDVMGGVETHCAELLPRLLQRLPGAQITVYGRAEYCRAGSHRGVLVRPLWAPRHKRLEALAHTAASVVRARLERADLLHIHAIGPALLTPFAKAMGLRVLVTHHGADYRRAKWGPVARAALLVGEWLAVRAADRVIAVSEADAERLRRAHPRQAGRILAVPNGAPKPLPHAPVDDARILAEFGVRPGRFVLTVGRLVPEKRLDDLIEAMQRLQAAGDGRTLAIAGDADHADAYAAALRRKAERRIRFLGRVDQTRLGALYRGCERFVLASSHEGLPIVALEAIAGGAPVLLSDIGANRDLRLPAGCYFPVGNVGALAQRLAEPPAVVEEPAALLARFDWERIAADTARIYMAAIRGGRAGSAELLAHAPAEPRSR